MEGALGITLFFFIIVMFIVFISFLRGREFQDSWAKRQPIGESKKSKVRMLKDAAVKTSMARGAKLKSQTAPVETTLAELYTVCMRVREELPALLLSAEQQEVQEILRICQNDNNKLLRSLREALGLLGSEGDRAMLSASNEKSSYHSGI